MGSKCFNGEVWTNVHPDIMQAMMAANLSAVDGKVGLDGYSQRAVALLQQEFHQPVSVMYTYNGTAANVLALKHLLRPWETILGAACTHINTHESGATEYATGSKILTIPSVDGKITPAAIEDYLSLHGGTAGKVRVLVLTQPTELGVLYSVDEIRALCETAHAHDMLVFIDGARLTHALTALNTDLHTMIEATGVDAFTFGGTKAGLMFGEMVVFLHPESAQCLKESQKQSQQHMDKSKFLGAQFECLLRDKWWRKTAGHANAMAHLLADRLAQHGIKPYYPADTNMFFAVLTPGQLRNVQTAFDLDYWDKSLHTVRFCATHETTEDMIDQLVSLIIE